MGKWWVAGLALAISAGTAWGQPPSPLQPSDVFDLEAAADPRIAPDGDLIAYVRRSNDIRTDTTVSAIWLTGDDAHRPLPTDATSTDTPRWSADGTLLAYIATRDDKTALHVFAPATGEDRQIAALESRPANLAWSPDGEHLAYAAFVPGAGFEAAALPERGEDMEWAASAQVEQRLGYRFDGVGPIPAGRQQLFLIDMANGETRQLTADLQGASPDFAWAPDGQSLIFSADRRENAGTLAPDTELHRFDLASGEIATLTDRRGPDNSPRPSPDGTQLAYLGFDDRRMGYHNVLLYVADADGNNARVLTGGLDRSVASPQWRADGSGLYVQFDDRGQTRVAFVGLDGTTDIVAEGLIGPTFGRPYTGGSYSVSATDRIAATVGSPRRPAEIYAGPAGGTLVPLTDLNSDALEGRHLSDAEEIRWRSPHDGREIQGWVLYPPDFDEAREWPLILEIHGGPFAAYGPAFSAELQLMAAAGHVVIYTNPRGSTSYGDAFANLIHHDYPGNDYDDLMGAVDHMLGRGFIDEDRLFVTGGSGGGVLTAWIVGNTDRFAAAAVVKPVINWASFVLYADLPQFFFRYWFASPPWEDPMEYWRRSPLSLVGNVSTPTLMMVGGADLRTPRAETEQYYAALQLRGVPTRLVVIPDTFHGIANSRPSRLLTKVAEILRWFEEYDPARSTAAGEAGVLD